MNDIEFYKKVTKFILRKRIEENLQIIVEVK